MATRGTMILRNTKPNSRRDAIYGAPEESTFSKANKQKIQIGTIINKMHTKCHVHHYTYQQQKFLSI